MGKLFMNTILCPKCGQSNLSKSKLDYCSFCYSRFADSDSHEESDEEICEHEHSQIEATPEETIQAAIVEIVKFKGGHSTSICPACHQDVPWEDRTCPHCQFEITEEWILQRIQFIRTQIKEQEDKVQEAVKARGGHETMICPACRHNVPWEDATCPSCQFDMNQAWF